MSYDEILNELIKAVVGYDWYRAYELSIQLEREVERILLKDYCEPNKVGRLFNKLRLYLNKNVRDDLKSAECRKIIAEIQKELGIYGFGPIVASYDGDRLDVLLENYASRIDKAILEFMNTYATSIRLSGPAVLSERLSKANEAIRIIESFIRFLDSVEIDRREVVSIIEKSIKVTASECISSIMKAVVSDKGLDELASNLSELRDHVRKVVSMLRHPERTGEVVEAFHDIYRIRVNVGVLGEQKVEEARSEESEGKVAVKKTIRSGRTVTGKVSFDWVDDDWELVLQHPRIYIAVGHRGSGKCLAKGTKVVTEDGSLVEIEKLDGRKVVGLDLNDYKVKPCRSSPVIYSGKKKVYKVLLDTGREILATDNHPFLTIEGWKELRELKVGDRVATPRRIGVFGSEDLDENLVKVVAYLLGDGSVYSGLEFVNHNTVIIDDFKKAVEALGLKVVERGKNHFAIIANEVYVKKYPDLDKEGTDIVELYNKGYSINQIAKALNKHYWYVWKKLKKAGVLRSSREGLHMVVGNHLINLLREWGLYGATAETKFIPDPIFRLPKDKLKIFISRLFACDGSVYAGPKGRGYVVEYSSKSKRLIQQVQHLLLRFGIVSIIKEKVVNGNTYYRLIMYGKDAKKFVEEIGVFGKEVPKVEVPDNHNPNKDTLPKEIWKIVREEMERKGFSNLKLARALGVDKRYITNWKRYEPSRDKIKKIAEVLDSDLLRKLCSDDVYWDRIVKIEEVGVMDVYDIETEFSNFIANDIVVHNSSMAHAISEYLHYKFGLRVYFENVSGRPIPTEKLSLLPSWMVVIDDLSEAKNDSVVLVDEAYRKYHARTSMREATSRVGMDEILELSRQKNLTLIFVTQRTTKLDKNIIQAADTFLVKRLHEVQVQDERGNVKRILERAYNELRKLPRSLSNRYVYVAALEDGFEGLKQIGLPSYWNEELSRFYEGF